MLFLRDTLKNILKDILDVPVEFTLKVRKIGNSLSVVIPKPVCVGLGIKEGDQITLTVSDNEITIRKAKQ